MIGNMDMNKPTQSSKAGPALMGQVAVLFGENWDTLQTMFSRLMSKGVDIALVSSALAAEREHDLEQRSQAHARRFLWIDPLTPATEIRALVQAELGRLDVVIDLTMLPAG